MFSANFMKIALICITLLLCISQIISGLSVDNVIMAINCGGESFTDSKGVYYEKV
jgi:hypothetical protein